MLSFAKAKLKMEFFFFEKISKCQIFPDIVFFRAFCAQTTMSKCRGFDDKQTNERMDEQTNKQTQLGSSSSSK